MYQAQKNKFNAFLYVFFKKNKIKNSYSNKFHAFFKIKFHVFINAFFKKNKPKDSCIVMHPTYIFQQGKSNFMQINIRYY